jgi:hypothetical protein
MEARWWPVRRCTPHVPVATIAPLEGHGIVTRTISTNVDATRAVYDGMTTFAASYDGLLEVDAR